MQTTKIFIAGILLGGVVTGSVWAISNTGDNEAKLFANKERCVTYTRKRQAEFDEMRTVKGPSYSVRGFYSPVANTCMTNSQEISFGNYIQRTLIDELTGQTEASAITSTGKGLLDLSIEARTEQFEQDKHYDERLRYFQGI